MEANKEKYFQIFYDVVKGINSSLDPKTVIKQVAEKITWAMEVKACSIRLLSEDRKYLLVSAVHGLSEDYLQKGKVEVDLSVIDQEVLAGKNVYIQDVCNDSRFQYPEAAKREGIKSVMAVPLGIEGYGIIGVLRVYTSTEREFSQEEVKFLNAMSDLSAVAIKNAMVHDKLKYEHELLNRYTYQLFED